MLGHSSDCTQICRADSEGRFPPRGHQHHPPGKGRLVGQALVDNLDVRKIGFTGSTEVGKQIMKRWVWFGCGGVM